MSEQETATTAPADRADEANTTADETNPSPQGDTAKSQGDANATGDAHDASGHDAAEPAATDLHSDVVIRAATEIEPVTQFNRMPVGDKVLDAIQEMGFTVPTPVQAYAIPIAVRGHDLVACARTGTGKTAAYLMPILDWLYQMPPVREHTQGEPAIPRALVLAPTRELAQQIQVHLDALTAKDPLPTAVLVGGKLMRAQIQALRDGATIVIATPGRLLDHLERGNVRLSEIEMIVLDEADRMFDMGFAPQIRRLMQQSPNRNRRQTLMFSATMPRELTQLANEQLLEPARVEVDPPNVAAEGLHHDVLLLPMGDKTGTVVELLREHVEQGGGKVLIFTRTKIGCDQVADMLEKQGFDVARMHSDRSQEQREKALDRFRDDKVQMLVATDVASRGIDVQDIERVINYDFPQNVDDYIHRVGRTARAGAKGRATSVIGAEDLPLMLEVERALGYPLPRLGEEAGGGERRSAAAAKRPRRGTSRRRR